MEGESGEGENQVVTVVRIAEDRVGHTLGVMFVFLSSVSATGSSDSTIS